MAVIAGGLVASYIPAVRAGNADPWRRFEGTS